MIAIVDYGMGNLGSIHNMFHRLGVDSVVTGDPAVITRADKLILPGVGAFDVGMQNLERRGLIPLLETKVLRERTPLLGICLGMQLLTLRSEEGLLPGLGWIEAETIRFRFREPAAPLKVPHMGWNQVRALKDARLFDHMHEQPRFYFVHSYYVRCLQSEDIWLSCEYGFEFTAAFQHGNIFGVQFHPEKSHKFGLQLFRSFSVLPLP